VLVLLIDERPEEVTDFQRSAKAEVVAFLSTTRTLETHVRLSRFMIERCRRIVESGKDVFVLLDSITAWPAPTTACTAQRPHMTGGVDAAPWKSRARCSPPRARSRGRFADDYRHALVDTGSRMDELIFRSLKAPATWS